MDHLPTVLRGCAYIEACYYDCYLLTFDMLGINEVGNNREG